MKKAIFLSFSFLSLLCLLSGCSVSRNPNSPTQVTPATPAKPDYAPLQKKIVDILNTRGGLCGFYLYDLKSGESLSINAKMPMAAASCIKVPIVLYFYRQVAEGEIDLNNRMAYIEAEDFESGAGALQYFTRDGLKYRYRTLANFTITLSDNISTHMLIRKLGRPNINDFMRSLGGETVYPHEKNISTAHDLFLFLRATLDFAKIHPELGQMFLNDLSNTIWDNDGIPAQLPAGVSVAHKVGSLPGVANDVGVVFLKGRPYILCILTEGIGQNEEDGFKAISEISRIVYNFQAKLPAAGK